MKTADQITADIRALLNSSAQEHVRDSLVLAIAQEFADAHSLRDGDRVDDWLIPRQKVTIRVTREIQSDD
jgi:hypothetical protein